MSLAKGSFGRRVLTIASGTTLAQLLGVVLTPFITRLYAVDEYAQFAIFSSWLMVLAYLICGKYPMALVASKDDREASNMKALSMALTLFWVIVSVPSLIILDLWDSTMWMLFPLAILFNGWQQTEYGWNLRHHFYKSMALSRIFQTALTSGLQVLLGYFAIATASSLVVGVVVGLMAATAILRWGGRHLPKAEWSVPGVKKAMGENLSYPIMSMPAEFISTFSLMLPGLLLPLLGFQKEVAYIFLAFKVTNLPFTLIATSISNVFLRDLNGMPAEKMLKAVYKLCLSLLALAIVPSIILAIWAPDLFALIFGSSWRLAGEYQVILLLWLVPRFAVHPALAIFDALKRPKGYLIVSGTVALVQVACFLYGTLVAQSVFTAVTLFSLAGMAGVVALFFEVVRVIKTENRA